MQQQVSATTASLLWLNIEHACQLSWIEIVHPNVSVTPIAHTLQVSGKVIRQKRCTRIGLTFAPLHAQAGPTANQTANSVVWLYRSTAEDNLQAHQNAGLYGPVIVTRKGFAGIDGKPTDVDREFVTVFFVSAFYLSWPCILACYFRAA